VKKVTLKIFDAENYQRVLAANPSDLGMVKIGKISVGPRGSGKKWRVVFNPVLTRKVQILEDV
jgi:hypothetical protein